MKAVIMAGGDGKRLRPLSCTMPKPMVPLLNKPVLGYCMELIKKHGFDEAILTLRYLPNVIRRYIGDGSAFGIKAECAVEDKPMGAAGGVKNARKSMNDLNSSAVGTAKSLNAAGKAGMASMAETIRRYTVSCITSLAG